MHKKHDALESDELFEIGTLHHIVPGNEGRVLDGRRTPGYIESFDIESCMFIWRITAFEDKGKCWEIPAEEISAYQFRKNSVLQSNDTVESIKQKCNLFKERLIIPFSQDALNSTELIISEKEKQALSWLKMHSRFVKGKKSLDLSATNGDVDLYADLAGYLSGQGLVELERRTAEQYVLNPYSSEWIKGMKIVMAELGLIAYDGTIPRSKDIFEGIGDKELRKRYVVARSAFLRAVFKMCGYHEVPLYRGVSSSIDLYEMPSSLLSTTFSSEMAKEYAAINDPSAYRSCYWAKFLVPVNNLFMTFFETQELNERYREHEAIIFYRK